MCTVGCDLGVRTVYAEWHDGLNSDLLVGSEHVVSMHQQNKKMNVMDDCQFLYPYMICVSV